MVLDRCDPTDTNEINQILVSSMVNIDKEPGDRVRWKIKEIMMLIRRGLRSPKHHGLIKGSGHKLSCLIATHVLHDSGMTSKTVNNLLRKQTIDVNGVVSFTIAVNILARRVPSDTRSTIVTARMPSKSGNTLIGPYFVYIV